MGNVTNRKVTAPLPKLERQEDGFLKVQATSEDSMRLIFGTETNELADGLLLQCVNALNGAETHEQDFMVAAVKEISPRERCRAPAVRGWNVCRFHGAGGGAPRGQAHGKYTHGGRSIELLEAKRMIAELQRMARETLDNL